MSATAKKSIAFTWMFALLIATMGVSIHQVYCYCAGVQSVSLFAIADQCEGLRASNTARPACCAKKAEKERSCCKKDAQSAKKGKHGCTKKSVRVFQLKTEFTLEEKAAEKHLHFPLDLRTPPVFTHAEWVTPSSDQVSISTFPNPPPPLSGRMICVRHGIARC
ncbi:MAG: hypothetical protein JNM22_05095 [Saprospiraceae bacterium]|nr:hypothetical protein [Saprospiraceae bacterium]